MAARTLAQYGPMDAVPNSATFPAPGVDGQSRPFLAMATNESFDLQWQAPAGLTTPLSALITYRMSSATSNNVKMRIAIEAISDGDTVDTDSASSFASDNDSSDTTVPSTAGYIDQISITLTNDDSVAAGDLCRLRVTRIAPSGSAATGDLEFLALELRDDGA